MNVTSGSVAENWSYFRKIWNDYKIATSLGVKDKKICIATLKGIMYKDCYNIYKRLPLEDESKERVQSNFDGLELWFSTFSVPWPIFQPKLTSQPTLVNKIKFSSQNHSVL